MGIRGPDGITADEGRPMTVVYVVFAVAGWAWLVMVGLYMGRRIIRERMECVVPATQHERHEQQC